MSGQEECAVKDSRRKSMEALINQRQSVTMEELCQQFGISINTARADVAHLVRSGAVEKIYGGVRAVNQGEVPLFTQRTLCGPEQKLAIARQAEAQITDGDIVYIDAGTTTMHIIDCLSPDKHITVVTGNLYVIQQASHLSNVELIVLPGLCNRRTNSVADVGTLEFLSRYHTGKAFMGASGISEDGRLQVSTYMEYELKKVALRQTRQAYLLADSSKFGSTGLMYYGTAADMHTIITDTGCPDSIREIAEKNGVRLISV